MISQAARCRGEVWTSEQLDSTASSVCRPDTSLGVIGENVQLSPDKTFAMSVDSVERPRDLWEQAELGAAGESGYGLSQADEPSWPACRAGSEGVRVLSLDALEKLDRHTTSLVHCQHSARVQVHTPPDRAARWDREQRAVRLASERSREGVMDRGRRLVTIGG